MKTYQIAGITIGFNYRYDTYFKNNIEAYEVFQPNPSHQIDVIYQEALKLPKRGQTKIFTQNASGVIKAYMSYTANFKKVKLYIDPQTFMDLATAEYVYSGMVFLEIALKKGLIPLHGTAISYLDDAILFSAPPGTGKSTHARFWMREYPNQVSMINDDKPLLSIEKDGIYVAGSPFSGANKQSTNQKKKLKAIVFLSQGVTNEVTKVSTQEALKLIINNSLKPHDDLVWQKAIKKLQKFITKLPTFHLEATMSNKAVKAIHQAIYQ